MARISAVEFAELVPCSANEVSRLEDLGLLVRAEDGLFASSDVHVVRLMTAFEEAHVPLEDVARGVSAGDLSFPLEMFLPEVAPRPETFEQLAARLDRTPRAPQAPELGARVPGFRGRPRPRAGRRAPRADDRDARVSEEARQFATGDGVSFELVGDVHLKGLTRSVRLHRALRAR